MWDISNTTTWIRGRHTLNFGANYRKWSLQRDLANDFLGQVTFSGFFTGNRTRDHAIADMLLGYFSGASVFQPAGFGVWGRREIRASSTSCILPLTFRMTGK